MKSKGSACEALAARYLIDRGLRILSRNYTCRFGEIDLIAIECNCLVFIEVKSRSNQRTMSLRETLSTSKQHKIMKTARHFLAKNSTYADSSMRFDFIGIDTSKETIDWLQDAFQVQ